jgi:Domain of unknown function (DUF892)
VIPTGYTKPSGYTFCRSGPGYPEAWGAFFQAHPDTPGKRAAFAFAFEHLEIAGYQLLWRVARRAGDQDTIAIAQRIVAQERSMAARLAGSFDRAVQASLSARGVLA